jgi:hypothetical protein
MIGSLVSENLVGQAHSEKKKKRNNNNNNNNNKKRCKNKKSPNFVWGHGNRERMSKSLTSLISETAKGISTKLGIYIKEGW